MTGPVQPLGTDSGEDLGAQARAAEVVDSLRLGKVEEWEGRSRTSKSLTLNQLRLLHP
jgi:hypothetical protein